MFIRSNPELSISNEKEVLQDIVLAITTEFPTLEWYVYDVEVSTCSELTIADVDRLTNRAISRLQIIELSSMIDAIVDIKIIPADRIIPAPINGTEMKEVVSKEVYVEYFDSSYWTVFSRSAKLMKKFVDILIQ